MTRPQHYRSNTSSQNVMIQKRLHYGGIIFALHKTRTPRPNSPSPNAENSSHSHPTNLPPLHHPLLLPHPAHPCHPRHPRRQQINHNPLYPHQQPKGPVQHAQDRALGGCERGVGGGDEGVECYCIAVGGVGVGGGGGGVVEGEGCGFGGFGGEDGGEGAGFC